MIAVKAQLSYEQLLEAVSRLSTTDLEKFQAQITKLRANKRDQSLPQQEFSSYSLPIKFFQASH